MKFRGGRNVFKDVYGHGVRFAKGVHSGIRGTLSGDRLDLMSSRQVNRRALFVRCFNEVSGTLDLPRRNRRLIARRKAARLYREFVKGGKLE